MDIGDISGLKARSIVVFTFQDDSQEVCRTDGTRIGNNRLNSIEWLFRKQIHACGSVQGCDAEPFDGADGGVDLGAKHRHKSYVHLALGEAAEAC